MQFTNRTIQALKPKSVRYDLREGGGEGFGVRVATSGEKSWIFFYHFNQKKRRMTLGKYPKLSLAQARVAHRAALIRLQAGQDPALEERVRAIADQTAPTLQALAELYLEKWAKPRKRSWQEDERMLNKDVLSVWGHYKAQDIQRKMVIGLLDSIAERGAPIVANRTLALMRRMFNFAIERDLIAHNPCYLVKPPGKESQRDRLLSMEEIRRFWQC
jgi:hypothetical protein